LNAELPYSISEYATRWSGSYAGGLLRFAAASA
jgi:hypothetical protein